MTAIARKMPAQRPHKSEQVVRAPPEFLEAVRAMFGTLHYDLAANQENRIALDWYGPDHPVRESRDALTATWPDVGRGWLNPPFGMITKFARKAFETTRGGLEVLMLVPASIGANWYTDFVAPFADVYSVGRMKFVGSKDVYPKDLILAHYWQLGGGKLKRWRWEE